MQVVFVLPIKARVVQKQYFKLCFVPKIVSKLDTTKASGVVCYNVFFKFSWQTFKLGYFVSLPTCLFLCKF